MTAQWSGRAAGADSGNVAMPESMTANAINMLVKPRNAGSALAIMLSVVLRDQSRSDSTKGTGSDGRICFTLITGNELAVTTGPGSSSQPRVQEQTAPCDIHGIHATCCPPMAEQNGECDGGAAGDHQAE